MFENYFKTIVEIFKEHENLHKINDTEREQYLDKVASFLNRYYQITGKNWRDFIDIENNSYLITNIGGGSYMIGYSDYFSDFNRAVSEILKIEKNFEVDEPYFKNIDQLKKIVYALIVNITDKIDKEWLFQHLKNTAHKNYDIIEDKNSEENTLYEWLKVFIYDNIESDSILKYRKNELGKDLYHAVNLVLKSLELGYDFAKEKERDQIIEMIKSANKTIESKNDLDVGF